jgi:hypothetical protein
MAVVCNELVNITKCSYLKEEYTFEEFFALWNGNKNDAKIEYKKIMDYLDTKIKQKHSYEKYNHITGRTDGRLYGSKGSIQNVSKNIRNFICDGKTTDVDMNNAHPSILYKLCEKYNYECPNLERYINNRDEIIEKIMKDDNICKKEAKELILKATNYNQKLKSNNEFTNNYSKEMLKIQQRFLDNRDFDYVKEYAKKDKNFEGSFINHILCIHENNILSALRTWCAINKYDIHSLMFDGLMVIGDLRSTAIPDMEQYIHENTMFDNIKLSIKEQDTTLELPDDYVMVEKQTYDIIAEEFNKRNCKVGQYFVREDEYGYEVFKKGEFIIINDELQFYPLNAKKEIPFTCEWFKDPTKRIYDRFDSYPKQEMCPKNVYNTWKPFEILKVPETTNDDVIKGRDFFLNHIMILCGNDEKVYNFIILWLSQMFQYPENKTIMPIFISKEGTGKGIFLEFLKTIIGASRVLETTDPLKDIFGNFNGLMKGAFLVVFNESNKSNFYNQNDKKKGIITDSVININQKGIAEQTITSQHRFITFTNNPDPAAKNKRRDLFIRCSDEKVNNVEYFKQLALYSKDKQVCRAIYDWLMEQPTKPFIVNNDIPETEYDKIIEENQFEPAFEFLKSFYYSYKDGNINEFTGKRLYEMFDDWKKDNNIQFTPTKEGFLIKLAFYKVDGITKTRKRINKIPTWIYKFDYEKLKEDLNIKDEELEEFKDDSDDDEY